MKQLNTCPNSAMKRPNQRCSNTKFNYNKELPEAAIQRFTLKNKLLETNCKEVHSPAKLNTVGLVTKFGTVNYSTDICIIATEQNTFYSMGASIVKVYIQEIQSPRANLENDALNIQAKFMENACEGANLLQNRRLEACSYTKNKPSHSHPSRILPRS